MSRRFALVAYACSLRIMTLHRLSVLIAPVVILLLFASTLVGIDRLAFRDVSHFYLPLYDYVAERTSQQWLPLWNPLDQTGMPLIGETTTAVLYPVRYLVFALPLPTDVLLSWYLVLHLIIASLTSRWAALRSGASPLAATLAGVIYPLSGGVFFLYTNPPFLVGAAWLPLVLGVLISREKITATKRCLIAGPSMAMMILGGDPQTALHAMLVAAAVYAVRFLRSDAEGTGRATAISLIGVPLMAACLTAPQLAASLSWSGQSARVHFEQEQAWYLPPATGSHRSNAFQFSLPPWQAASLLTPNAWGRLFPVYQRISVMIPGDGRMWTPTIYLGLLAALAMTCRLLRREFDVWIAMAIGAFLLCLGHFGIVWLVQQIPHLASNVDSAIGGPYWMLYHFVPGYDSFRYPAKWLPVFSLAAAITSALWVDAINWYDVKRAIVMLTTLLLVGVAAFAILSWQGGNLPSYADPFWGPLDVAGAARELLGSILHSLIAIAAAVVVLRLLCQRKSPLLLIVLTLIAAIDLGYSNHQWLARVSRSELRGVLESERQNPVPNASLWIRARSGSGWPANWRRENDGDRLLEVAASEQIAWFGRWHLFDRQAVLNNMTSIRSHPMAIFWQACEEFTSGKNRNQTAQFWQSVHRWLGIDGVLTSRGEATRVGDADLVDVTYETKANERMCFHTTWSVSPKRDLQTFVEFLQAVHQSDGNPPPIIHLKNEQLIPDTWQQSPEYEITSSGENELTVQTNALGVLTRPVFQDGHWIAETRPAGSQQSVDWRSTRVYPISFLKQGILLTPGQWQVRFRYQPWWLPWSLMIALASWATLGWFLLRSVDGYFPIQNRPKTRSRMSSV